MTSFRDEEEDENYEPADTWEEEEEKEEKGKVGVFSYILSVIDTFSKKVWLRALTHSKSIQVAEALKDILSGEKGNWPKTIRSDNGEEFQLEVADMFSKAPYNVIKRTFTKPYHPNENAIVERSNRNVRDLIR